MGLVKDIWRGKTAWQIDLKSKIWRATTRLEPPSDQPVVIFAVPLVSRRRAPDWGQTCANLAQTIDCFRAQTCDQWQAVICGQDKPDGIDFDDQIQFLKSHTSDKFFDKGDKRRQIISHVSKTVKTDGYYMPFDADDILHPKAVEHMCQDNNGAGYYIDSGYMHDIGNDLFAPLKSNDSTPGVVPFYTLCGSCCAVRYDFRNSRSFRRLLNEMKAHGQIISRMKIYGFQMAPFPFPTAIYMLNHGQNMVKRRDKIDGKLGYIQRHAVEDTDQIAEIRQTFNL